MELLLLVLHRGISCCTRSPRRQVTVSTQHSVSIATATDQFSLSNGIRQVSTMIVFAVTPVMNH